MMSGTDTLRHHLDEADALPLRDYVPYTPGRGLYEGSCRGRIDRSHPDDDITYTVLALMMLERYGAALSTVEVARSWLQLLPIEATFTAERAAYLTLSERGNDFFAQGADPDFDPTECADNPYSDWIGAQIRADIYGWVCPGTPSLAAELARRDAALSHRGDGIGAACFIAALGALIPVSDSLAAATEAAVAEVQQYPGTVAAVEYGASLVEQPDPVAALGDRFSDLGPVHALNNLALVVWGLLSHPDDFSAAIGDTVAAGWDTDCNGATVGALWGLTGRLIPPRWTEPWRGRIEVSLAGVGELALEELADRTMTVAESLAAV